MRTLPIPLSLYFLAAVSAFVLPLLFKGPQSARLAVNVSFGLSALWALRMIYGFVKADKRMPRLMLGLPLVIFWPALSLAAAAICRYGNDCM